jgi:hypothetical protein
LPLVTETSSTVDLEQPQAMLFQATQWQQLAEQYDLIIANFLRAQAVANS